MVASIPLSFNTFVVKLAFNISLALALPLASISNLKASFSAFSILKSYSKASCSCFNFFSIASWSVWGKVTSLIKTASRFINFFLSATKVFSNISSSIVSLFVE